MRKEERIQQELERNIKYLESFKDDLKQTLSYSEIDDLQSWSEIVARKSQLVIETAQKIDTLKFVLGL